LTIVHPARTVLHDLSGREDAVENLAKTAFGPEELGSICEAFDQACSRLRQAGHGLGSGTLEELAAIILKMGARGLTGDELVEAAVRPILLRKGAA
jgi:hypothetical protein